MSLFARAGFVLFALVVCAMMAWYWLAPRSFALAAVQFERELAGLKLQQTRIPDFDIVYLDSHDGEPLVLLHGIGANKDNFGRVARFLTPDFRVIAPDLPGFGDSSKPADARYHIDDQARRMAEFLDVLELPRVHLGGSSMGGMIAATFAAMYPQRVASLWLIAPVGVDSAEVSEMLRHYRDTGEALLFARTPEEFDRVLDLVMSQPPFIPGAVKRVLAAQAAENHALHTRLFTQIHDESQPLESRVAGLATPTLVVWGEEDRVLHVSGADILSELMPNASVIRMPGIGHLPMLEAPRRTADDYRGFRRALD